MQRTVHPSTPARPVDLGDLPKQFRPLFIGGLSKVISFDTVIGPEEAIALLSRNPTNRRLDPRYVEQLADALRSGAWQFNGEAIIVDSAGNLADGQHRLAAIVSSGRPARTLVVVGVEPESRDTVDAGRRRTAANVLQMEGVPNASFVTAAASYVLRIEAGMMQARGGGNGFSRDRVVAFARENDSLVDAVSFCRTRFRTLAHSSLFAAVLFLCRQRDRVLADAFFLALAEGLGLTAGDPVYQLRQSLLARHGGQRQLEEWVYGMTVKAWNATRAGKRIRVLSYKFGTEEVPAIL